MIFGNQIPAAAIEAALGALPDDGVAEPRHAMLAIAAALSAWPGMRMMVDIDTGDDAAIKLPLPQEASDGA